MLAVAGGVTPLLRARESGLVASGWGYVALALSAGCVLFDRYFGYTSSWMRYMRAQARLNRVLVAAQAQWTAAMIRCAHDGAPADVLMPILQDLIRGTARDNRDGDGRVGSRADRAVGAAAADHREGRQAAEVTHGQRST